jgi:hypothetical protein
MREISLLTLASFSSEIDSVRFVQSIIIPKKVTTCPGDITFSQAMSKPTYLRKPIRLDCFLTVSI